MMALRRLIADQSGATSIEYALIGSLVSIAIVAAAITLGSKLDEMYSGIAGKVP